MNRSITKIAVVLIASILLPTAVVGDASHHAYQRVLPVEPAGATEGLPGYRFEHGQLEFMDLVTLEDDSMRLGKAMEWADQILIYSAAGQPSVLNAGHVKRIEFRRLHRHRVMPPLPDLTVGYIERLPRDPHLHGHLSTHEGVQTIGLNADEIDWRPSAGTQIIFRIHVLNAGSKPSAPALCRVSIDGKELTNVPLEPIAPGGRQALDVAWPWLPTARLLRVELQSQGATLEVNQWNNTFEEPIQALGVAVVVARDFYERFTEARNIVDSFCFEDWVQYQMRCLNALFRQSAFHSQPEGILERVRCDRILVVDDPDDPVERARWQAALRRNGDPNGLAEYAAVLVFGHPELADPFGYTGLKVDWPKLKQLCTQLGLIDLTLTDTRPEQCLARDHRRLYVDRQHLYPWPRTLMHTPGGFRLTEPEAAYLNRVVGRPRGFRGEYQYQLPEKITIVVHAGNGRPLENVQVDVYQLQAEGEYAGFVVGVSPGDPLYSAPTDALGRLSLLDQEAPEQQSESGYVLRPNPFGRIAPDGGNGLLLFKLDTGESEAFFFLRLHDCLTAYLQGQQQEYVVHLQTRFASPGAPPAIISTSIGADDRATTQPQVRAGWRMPVGISPRLLEEFRVYRRAGLCGEDASPWELVNVRRKKPEGWLTHHECSYWAPPHTGADYSADTFFAVSSVDREGRESNLSAPGFLAHGKDVVKMIVHRHYAVMTLTGDGPLQLLRWDGEIATHPYGVRNLRYPGYQPAFAGIAVNSDHRLVMTDPVNHVLAFYDDQGELTDLVPHRDGWPGFASDKEGEFYTPWDVAVDDVGRIYVADFGNDRVQILDSSARFVGLLDEGFAFRGPHALGIGNGHLCVTDHEGRRCRVYDISGETPQFVRQLPILIEADRGLVSRSGRVYITGRIAEKMESALLVFTPDGDGARYERTIENVEMGKLHGPRGLYLFAGSMGQHYGYCVNAFPFDVRRQLLE